MNFSKVFIINYSVCVCVSKERHKREQTSGETLLVNRTMPTNNIYITYIHTIPHNRLHVIRSFIMYRNSINMAAASDQENLTDN